MRTLIALFLMASPATAQCQKAGACAPPPAVAVYHAPVPAIVYQLPPPVVTYEVLAPAVVYRAAPVYAVPVTSVPLYAVKTRKQYSTPVRDFLFGR